MSRKLISAVIPSYNEEKNIPLLYSEMKRIWRIFLQDYELEIIFVNDGSYDNTWEEIKKLVEKDPAVRGIDFSRNFGHQIAVTAGYNKAKGDYIISLDADMQDPPALMVDMIEKAEEGLEVVYARRIKRNEGFLKQWTAYAFYSFLASVASVEIPKNVGDFRLIDRKVLSTLNICKEQARYLRGLVSWIGFKQAFVEFERPNRMHGETAYTWPKMLKLAFHGITSFSDFPLQIAKYIGFSTFLLGAFGLFSMIIMSWVQDRVFPVWVYLIVVLFLFSGIQFFVLWFIGEYIGRMYDEQKGRPLYIIREELNV